MLVIDCTGSMGWIHRYLKNHLSNLVSDFDKMGRSIAFGVVGFRDCYCPKYPAIEKFGFTHALPNSGYIFPTEEVRERTSRWPLRREENVSERISSQLQNSERFSPSYFDQPSGTRGIIPGQSIVYGLETFLGNGEVRRTVLRRRNVRRMSSETFHIPAERALGLLSPKGGGGNRGESSYYALRESLITPWPISRKRIIALFTDDRGHLPDIGIPSRESLRGDMHDAGINQLHIFTTDKKMDSYTWLSESTDDPYVFYHSLTKDMERLGSTFDEFVKTSSEWDFEDDEDDIDFEVSEGNPFAD